MPEVGQDVQLGGVLTRIHEHDLWDICIKDLLGVSSDGKYVHVNVGRRLRLSVWHFIKQRTKNSTSDEATCD